MTEERDVPDPILTFQHPTGSPVELGELDREFLETLGIGPGGWDRPLRVALSPQTSKRGNVFYSYVQASVPLPDGLDTELRLNGLLLDGSEPYTSKKGNPTRQFEAQIEINESLYDVVAYVTKTGTPYWVKVHAQRAAKRRTHNQGPGPIGGKLV